MRYAFVLILALFLVNSAFAGPKVYLENNFLDLGLISEGKINEASFFIANNGDTPLEIKAVTVSCGCVKIVSPKESVSVLPGQKTEVKLTLDSTGLKGNVEKYIYITTNDAGQPLIKFPVKAEILLREENVIERFKSFRPLAVLGAGLIDGINPCAFTVLVFFVSFLTFVGYSRRQMFIIGLAFIFSVYLTYFLVGLGLFDFLRRLEIFSVISRLIYFLTALAAFSLGAVSLYDFWIYHRTHDPERLKLQLPKAIKHQIHKVIRMDLGKKQSFLKLIIASLVCGFLVSFLELICTGQLYLPTIVYILKVESLRLRALAYLVLYNVMFVAPLILILIFGVAGITSERFAILARKNLAGIKLITAFIFFGLGILLILMKG